MVPVASLGLAAGTPNQLITAGAGQTDITGSSFDITISRMSFIDYRVFATGSLTAAGAGNSASVSGVIVNFDNTAGIPFGSATIESGMIWYYPATAGPLQPGIYTLKMQAIAVGSNWTCASFFHQVFVFGAA